MRSTSSFGSALGAGAALLALAGCGGGSALAPAASQGVAAQTHARASIPAGPLSFADLAALRGSLPAADWSHLHMVDPASVKAQIDVSQYGTPSSSAGGVSEYIAADKKNKKPFCQITDLYGINAIETDSKGNLWVPYVTSDNVNQVVAYAPNCGKPGTTLSDPNGQPVDIAFATSGITYVSDILGASGSDAGNISVYPKGATAPTSTLTSKSVFYSLGVAVDSKGNVYQSFLGTSSGTGGGVLEFKGGKGSGTLLKGIKIDEPGTLFIDAKDNIIVPDQGAVTLNTYAPPYKKLTSSFPLQGLSIQCSIDSAEKTAACADQANSTADVYAYPAGTYQFSISTGLFSGLPVIGITQDPRY